MGLGPISIPPPVDFGALAKAGAEQTAAQPPVDLPGALEGLTPSDLPKPIEAPGLDLPRPAGLGGFDDVDLPGVIGAPIAEEEIELPQRGTPAAASNDLDLPRLFSREATEIDPPAPGASGGLSTDVDLPTRVVSRRGSEELDLPAPAASRPLDNDFDLPTPRGSSGLGSELDLPALHRSGLDPSADLPAPRGAMSGFGDEIDLPMGRIDAELPAPAFDSVDLPTPSGQAEELPILREDFAEASLGVEIESFERQHGAGPIELDMEPEELPLELIDDEPGQVHAVPVAPPLPTMASAEAAALGELELPTEGDLEFSELPADGSVAGISRVPGAKPVRAPAARVKKKPKKIVLPPWFARAAAATAVLGLIVGAGFYLGGTKYGLFGVHLVEPYLPGFGDPVAVTEGIQAAERKLGADTYDASKAAMAELAVLQAGARLNRELAARRVMHEALFQHRFGNDAESQQRIEQLQGFLGARGNEASGIELAQAAVALRNGDVAGASTQLSQASAAGSADVYFDILSAELALLQGQAQSALEAFQRALDQTPTALVQWGISRAYGQLRDAEKEAEAARQTLVQSPDHAAARVVAARALIASGDEQEALKLLEGPAGLKEDKLALASVLERSDALGLLAEVEERRGRRGVALQTYEKAAQMNPRNIKAALGAARLILEEGNYQEAFTRFQALINAGVSKSAPAHVSGQPTLLVEAKLGAVRALLLMGQAKEAQGLLADLQTEQPVDPELELWHGKVAEGLGDGDAAVKHFRNALELDEEYFAAYVSLSQYYAGKGKPDKAIAVLEKAEKHVEMNAEVHRVRGQAELARNRVEDAISQFKKALEKEPLDASSAFGLAVAYRRLGRLEEAQEELDRVESIDAAYPGLSLEKGMLAEARGDMAKAAKSYRAALEKAPQDMALKSRLGAVLTITGQLDEAKALLTEVLKAQPYSAEAEHYLGRVALLRGDKSAARQHFLRAARLEPQNGTYRMYVGWAALESNEFANALRNFKRAIKIDPSLGDAYWLRGRIELRMGAVRDAAADFEKALKLNPSRVEAYSFMAEAYDQLGKPRKAIEAYAKGVEAAPENASWWYRLGRLQLDQGHEADASSSLTRAIALADASESPPAWASDAYRLLGDAHRAAGDQQQAIASYERYLEVAPADDVDREDVESLIRRLKH